jgi:hypothetical protein
VVQRRTLRRLSLSIAKGKALVARLNGRNLSSLLRKWNNTTSKSEAFKNEQSKFLKDASVRFFFTQAT